MKLQTVYLLVCLVLQGCIDEVPLSLKPLDYRFFDTDYIVPALDQDIPLESCDPNQVNWTLPNLHEGVCKNLSKVCKNGFYQEPNYQAVANYEQNEKSCDLLDNDCDGKVDENLDEDITCGIGACENRGQRRCINGQTVSQCLAKPITSQDDNSCNGMDEDCDGLNDNDFFPIPIDCGEGSCSASGFNNCLNGEIQSTCQPLEAVRATNDANCDAIDEDCDGFLDEDYLSRQITCNQGACQRMGIRTCRNGQLQDQCERVLPQPGELDTSCNRIDDDCDGNVDESYIPVVVSCGVGVCQATGTKTCNNGEEIEQCEPLRPFASDSTCDGRDEDCDGIVDEDFVERETNCGQSTCLSRGRMTCREGREFDTCIASSGSVEVCDNVDNDCDSRVDEDLFEMINCGTGACERPGTRICANGMPQTICAEGNPSAEICDGMDNNCDGEIDNLTPQTNQSCRVTGLLGECAQGISRCQNQTTMCTQTIFQTAEICDNKDNDCDGRIDENYVSTPTSCGVGACSNTGSMVCREGIEFDSCTPRQPQDEVCDGMDNNCDGATDTGSMGECTYIQRPSSVQDLGLNTPTSKKCFNQPWRCEGSEKICDSNCN